MTQTTSEGDKILHEPKYVAFALERLKEDLLSVSRGDFNFERTKDVALKAAVVVSNLKPFLVEQWTDPEALGNQAEKPEIMKHLKRNEVDRILHDISNKPSFFAEREFRLNKDNPLVRERGLFVLEVANVRLK